MPACKAEDEYTFCQGSARPRSRQRLQRHRETWITAKDFAWLAAHGINAVRLPVGYGVAEENRLSHRARHGGLGVPTAKEHGIGVLLDLHGAPGSQNGWDHSGRAGTLEWHTSKDNVDHTLASSATWPRAPRATTT